MKCEEIDALAKKKEPLPKDALLCDISLWYALRGIYREYRAGTVSLDIAKRDKARAIEKHRELELWEHIHNDHAKRMNEIGRLLVKANKGECVCKQMAAVFDGRINETYISRT